MIIFLAFFRAYYLRRSITVNVHFFLVVGQLRPRTHGNVFLRFCIVYCSQGNREQPAHYLKQYKNARKRFGVYSLLD